MEANFHHLNLPIAKSKPPQSSSSQVWFESHSEVSTAPPFSGPVLACECTSMKATLLMGGPEPADGGRLNIIMSLVFWMGPWSGESEYSLYSDITLGDSGRDFAESEWTEYKQTIMPSFAKFLQECYRKL